jgi:hypothetical protein
MSRLVFRFAAQRQSRQKYRAHSASALKVVRPRASGSTTGRGRRRWASRCLCLEVGLERIGSQAVQARFEPRDAGCIWTAVKLRCHLDDLHIAFENKVREEIIFLT